MIARFNIYFNATQKMEVALDGLAKKQKDDFAKIDLNKDGYITRFDTMNAGLNFTMT